MHHHVKLQDYRSTSSSFQIGFTFRRCKLERAAKKRTFAYTHNGAFHDDCLYNNCCETVVSGGKFRASMSTGLGEAVVHLDTVWVFQRTVERGGVGWCKGFGDAAAGYVNSRTRLTRKRRGCGDDDGLREPYLPHACSCARKKRTGTLLAVGARPTTEVSFATHECMRTRRGLAGCTSLTSCC